MLDEGAGARDALTIAPGEQDAIVLMGHVLLRRGDVAAAREHALWALSILSAIGLYGVVSFVVGERRGEIGIRVALGAQRGDVGRMIVMQSVRLAVIGVVVGVAAALATTRLLQSLLFEVQPTDPATLAVVSVGLVLLAAAASWVPARRAMRVSPVEALRGT